MSAPSASPHVLQDLFGEVPVPVIAAWGGGVDSTAMLIELIERGETPDLILFADTGDERPETYAAIETFRTWLRAHGTDAETVRYEARQFKHYPPYRSLSENVLTNATVPGIALGRGSCSAKWKAAPQHKRAQAFEPARRCWAAGGKVIKLIGYDCSPADNRRHSLAVTLDDPLYALRYPLREWGWTRADCEARIRGAGLPVPPKSACFMCTAMKPHELHTLPLQQLRRIVLIEARAKPRLRNCDGLWRKPVKGMRGATPRPGAMTDYIRDQGLLPTEDIAEIIDLAPMALTRFQEAAADIPIENRPTLAQWLRLFDMRDRGAFDVAGQPRLYADTLAPS